MKKVLVTGLSANIGGVETFYLSYYRLLKEKGYKFDFITTEENIAFEKEILNNNDSVYKLPNFKTHPVKYCKKLNEIMKKNSYDVLHANMLSAANILPLKIGKKNDIKKIIAHSHNGGMPSGLVKKMLNLYNKKRVPRYANCFLACSNLAGNWFFGNNVKFKVLKNAIDVEKFSFSKANRENVRNKYNIGESILIGHIGRVCEQKNQLFLVKFFKELKNNNVDCKLMMLGNGENEELSAYLSDTNIIKLENQNDINKYYSAFDIFVLPSLFEGLPVVGIEAQANGLPCLFSDRITEELRINDNCKFITLEENRWADEIIKMINDNNIQRTQNIKLHNNGYSIKDASDELDEIYRN